ncbi:MAG: peptidase S9 [Betaproteobacteria bacterium]
MEISSVRRLAVAAAALAFVAASAPAVSAQYFGQNKVQYKNLKFRVLKTAHFDIYFYPDEQTGVELAAEMAERWNARLERIFQHKLRGRQPLLLYASHTDFEQTNAIEGQLGEGTGGVTEPVKRRIVLPLGGPLVDTDHVIGHELVHAFQFDMTAAEGSPAGVNGAERLPLWFIEGMAEYLSLGPVDPNTAMWLRDALNHDKLPAIRDLDNPKYFPYRWGQAFWAYVGGRWGDGVIHRMLAVAAAAGDVNVAFKKVLDIDDKQLSKDWQAAIRDTYAPVLAKATPPTELGHRVIKGTPLGGDNVGPALSPDGRWLSFLSTRPVFSTDLYIADARTGRIVRKLTSTETDPHYSSLQFIYSAGAWDASSRHIAVATVTGGHAALAVFDAQSGRRQQEIEIPQVDEILNPTWAPDGHAVCFTAFKQGVTDLYIYDFTKQHLERLTDDPYADIQPSWSPDGTRIAFATDRFSTKLDTLDIGDYRLATIDPESGKIDQVRVFTSGKDINPQWAPDGRSLYFISDRDGIPNLYRVTLATGDLAQLTDVATGLSGITSSSPALSVAGNVAAYSIYEDGDFNIYTLPLGTQQAAAPGAISGNAAVLPPIERHDSEVLPLLHDPTLGLPPADQFVRELKVDRYKPSLSLEAVGQPTVAVGADRFGAAIGGGAAFLFGDMLGDHTLATAVQVNSLGGNFSIKDTAAQVAYYNQTHRWNWGVLGGQIPYVSGGFASGVGTVQDQPAEIDQTIIFRQTERSAAGLVQYPFNRAQRVEFQGGVSQISFDQVVQTQAFSLLSGELLDQSNVTTPLADSLTLGTTSAALVFDNANFGATSPVQGQRYRLEAAPTFGSINYTSLLADYRRYFMPVSFYTIAGRILHYGRYGSGGEDPRLFPLFIGYPDLIRGYDVGTFDPSECVPSATSTCPSFDRLLGSRVLVGNLELRFPLLRPFGVSQRMYGPVPVEVALFADGGVAWDSGERPSFLGGHRQAVSSAGVTFRANFFGYLVGEFDFSRPFQRPGRGWVFQFNISPGF